MFCCWRYWLSPTMIVRAAVKVNQFWSPKRKLQPDIGMSFFRHKVWHLDFSLRAQKGLLINSVVKKQDFCSIIYILFWAPSLKNLGPTAKCRGICPWESLTLRHIVHTSKVKEDIFLFPQNTDYTTFCVDLLFFHDTLRLQSSAKHNCSYNQNVIQKAGALNFWKAGCLLIKYYSFQGWYANLRNLPFGNI